jgi:glycosyltransferase involved in cell wall biosynthesis
VYRPAALARNARDNGYRVTVFASPAPADPSDAGKDLLAYVGPGVEIIRAPLPGPRPDSRWFPQIDGGLDRALDLYASARAHLRKSPPDIIFASGPPFQVFVTGRWLARCFGAKLVLDYRDEWSLCPFDFVFKSAFGRRCERRCLRSADRVLFTTDAQLQMLASTIGGPWLLEKSRLAPNGWEPAQHSPISPVQRIASGRIILLFAGTLGEHTNVQPFLDALEQIVSQRPEWTEALVVRFLGQVLPTEASRLERFRYPEIIDVGGLVPLAEAVRQMRDADALLLFHDDRIARYLPGKLYEYLASGRPVIACNDHGESKRLVEALGAGWAIDCADASLLTQILASLMDGSANTMNGASRQAWLRRHTREALAKDVLDDLFTLF